MKNETSVGCCALVAKHDWVVCRSGHWSHCTSGCHLGNAVPRCCSREVHSSCSKQVSRDRHFVESDVQGCVVLWVPQVSRVQEGNAGHILCESGLGLTLLTSPWIKRRFRSPAVPPCPTASRRRTTRKLSPRCAATMRVKLPPESSTYRITHSTSPRALKTQFTPDAPSLAILQQVSSAKATQRPLTCTRTRLV